ncbi:hypothetical protein ACS0TY_001401 [Phlomoides rotata]
MEAILHIGKFCGIRVDQNGDLPQPRMLRWEVKSFISFEGLKNCGRSADHTTVHERLILAEIELNSPCIESAMKWKKKFPPFQRHNSPIKIASEKLLRRIGMKKHPSVIRIVFLLLVRTLRSCFFKGIC